MSIGDLFGDDLRALFREVDEGSDATLGPTGEGDGGEAVKTSDAELGGEAAREPDAPDGEAPVHEASVGVSETALGVSVDGSPADYWSPAETAVRTVVAELSGVRSEEVDLTAPLAALGAEGLGLWAVVAELERQTDRVFPDRVVLGWQTPSDMIAAGESGGQANGQVNRQPESSAPAGD